MTTTHVRRVLCPSARCSWLSSPRHRRCEVELTLIDGPSIAGNDHADPHAAAGHDGDDDAPAAFARACYPAHETIVTAAADAGSAGVGDRAADGTTASESLPAATADEQDADVCKTVARLTTLPLRVALCQHKRAPGVQITMHGQKSLSAFVPQRALLTREARGCWVSTIVF